MSSPELDVAVRAARAAGDVAMEYRRRGVRAEWKAKGDVVTAADHAAQARVAEVIGEAFGGDALIGEEGAPPAEASVRGRRRWYVDPIDGTSNYVKGRHWFGVSVAFCDDDDQIAAGAVYLPALDELYASARGQGATCNGEAISCSAVEDLEEALCTSGFPGAAALAESSERNLEAWRRVMHASLSLRATGAIAPDWCSVACGQSDASWTLRVGRWDIAAGLLIAREAGARVTDFAGNDLTGPSVAGLAAAPGIHSELLAILRDALPEGVLASAV